MPLEKAIRKIAGTTLYIMPAGEAVINPLELAEILARNQADADRLPSIFQLDSFLDSPPLLFAADAASSPRSAMELFWWSASATPPSNSVTMGDAVPLPQSNNVVGIVAQWRQDVENCTVSTPTITRITSPKEVEERRGYGMDAEAEAEDAREISAEALLHGGDSR